MFGFLKVEKINRLTKTLELRGESKVIHQVEFVHFTFKNSMVNNSFSISHLS